MLWKFGHMFGKTLWIWTQSSSIPPTHSDWPIKKLFNKPKVFIGFLEYLNRQHNQLVKDIFKHRSVYPISLCVKSKARGTERLNDWRSVVDWYILNGSIFIADTFRPLAQTSGHGLCMANSGLKITENA